MPSKPGRPPTAGTRRGNGSGHGGPAKGAGAKAPGPGRPKGLRNGEGKRSVADILIEAGAQQLAADAWLAIINDPGHPKHAEMVAKVAERMDGAPVQPVRGEGGPLILVTGVERAED